MKKKFLQVAGVVAAAAVLTWVGQMLGWWQVGSAEAVGDLVIDWGVPTGDPIFVVEDAVPGQIVERIVLVTNNSPVKRMVGVRNTITDLGGLEDVLMVAIEADGIRVYGEGSATGPKNLGEFAAESADPSVIDLVEVGKDGGEAEIKFILWLAEIEGNDIKGEGVVFDLRLGVSGDPTALPPECEGIEFTGETIIGSAKSELIRGTVGNDLIFGLEGSDRILGRGGDDCIVGGAGSDSMKGEDGNDVILGGAGSDSLSGGKGDDRLFGEGGSDSLKGDAGDDYLDGGVGGDSLQGGAGDDELIGGPGVDSAKGQGGTDICVAESVKTCEL